MERKKEDFQARKTVAAFEDGTGENIELHTPKHLIKGDQTGYKTCGSPDRDFVRNDPVMNSMALRSRNLSGSRSKPAGKKRRVMWGVVAALLLAALLVGGWKICGARKASVDLPPDDGAILYAIGKEFEKKKDYSRAAEWFEKAAEARDTNAMKMLGYMYYNHLGVEGDIAKSVEWYKKAADAEDAGAMNAMGWLYRYSSMDDPEEALAWFLKSADAGYAGAMTEIGDLYKDGFGVTQDYTEAMKWYRKASKAGDPVAMNQLGRMYEAGQGVEKNIDKAMEWYIKSAEAGNYVTMYNLGYKYETGEGVPQDSAKALEWYWRAMEAGSEPAVSKLIQLYS